MDLMSNLNNMDGYDIAQICTNGHVITSMADSSPDFKKDFCKRCGYKTICNCVECNQPIKGYYHVSGVIGGSSYEPPRFCDSCGSTFPWIKVKIEAANELVELIETLSPDEKKDFQSAIDELIRETAKVPVAKVKLKKYLSKVNSDISDGIRDVLRDTLSKELKNELIK